MQGHGKDFIEIFAPKIEEKQIPEKSNDGNEIGNVEGSTKSEVTLLLTLKK